MIDPMPELALDDEPFDLEDLDAVLELDPGPAQPDQITAITAVNDGPISFGLAEWMMRHRVAIDQNLGMLDEQYADQAERLTRWHAAARHRLEARAQFFDAALVRYAADHRALDPKRNKTATLPSGEISSRESKPAPIVSDEDAVIVWAKDTDAETLVRVKEEPALAEIKKVVKVVDVVVWRGWLVTTELGGVSSVEATAPDQEGPAIGDEITVSDGIGERVDRVTEVEEHTRSAAQVIDAAGERVPGMIVKPGEVKFTVRPAS